jgi:hypothetical protein
MVESEGLVTVVTLGGEQESVMGESEGLVTLDKLSGEHRERNISERHKFV